MLRGAEACVTPAPTHTNDQEARVSTTDTIQPNDLYMVRVAKARGIVRLYNGQLATLLSWGTPGTGRRAGTGNRIRLEGCDGETRWTGRKYDVIEVVDARIDAC